ncbi:MAG: alpha/beta hydrolase [Proteobacteria bacterium]|nr:MAG: alpha/beta hydrolase [Pseudomonadota bacterium]
MSDVVGPTSHFFVSQRLRLHYVDWGNPAAPAVVLVHGGRDHARNWDWVARDLRGDFHVIAPDLRGHGDSAWAVGGMYAVADFVLDLANLIDALGEKQVILVGHSLGGAISLMYGGIYPERVAKLVAIEGLGPPPALLARLVRREPWERMAEWVGQMRGLAARQPRRYATLADAAARMREENQFLSEEQAHHLTIHSVNRNEDGTFSWKFDNYVRTFAPYRFDVEDMRALWSRIACPVLLVRGEDSWASDPVKDGRIQPFQDARLVTIPKAGHWVHHDQLDRFLAAVRAFVAA